MPLNTKTLREIRSELDFVLQEANSFNVEIDVGDIFVFSHRVTIENELAFAGCCVIATITGMKPTDSRDTDEIMVEDISVFGQCKNDGEIILDLSPKFGKFSGKFVINYRVISL